MASPRDQSNVRQESKPVLGLTITQPAPARLCTIKDEGSEDSITPPATAHDEKLVGVYTTQSPYNSTPPRSSMEVYISDSNRAIVATTTSEGYPDLEAGHRSLDINGGDVTLLPSKCSKLSKVCTKDPAWPSLAERKQEKLQMRRNKAHCQWWARMNNNQRAWGKALIFLMLAGLIVGLSVGITKAVGGGVFSGNSTNKPIGS